MREPIIFILCCCFTFLLNGQGQTPLFETTIYFEDSIGNRDTIVVGYDPDADRLNGINTQFGEEDISHLPFDSIFEVRAAHYHSFNTIPGRSLPVSKKIIEWVEPLSFEPDHDCFKGIGAIQFFVYASNLPVKISWDREVFENNFCHVDTYLSESDWSIIDPDWVTSIPELAQESACLASENSFEINFDINDEYNTGFYRIEYIEGKTEKDTVPALLFVWGSENSFYSPCQNTFSTVSTSERNTDQVSSFIYPNPVINELSIIDRSSKPLQGEYEIYSINGNLMLRGEKFPINVKTLTAGIYLMKYKDKVHRFIKSN